MKTEPKFKIGQNVDPDSIKGPLQVVKVWWEDKTYGCKNGSWVYRLAFITKKGVPDMRKNFRQFEENRLAPLPLSKE